MQKFRIDNTEGYNQDQLEELNRRLNNWLRLSGFNLETIQKSQLDSVCEQILRDFDNEQNH